VGEGMPGRALVWGGLVALVLLAWPWLLAWLQARHPGSFAGTPVASRADLGHAWRDRRRPTARHVLVWSALALAASLLPAGNGWQAAELDAGLLWLFTLAVLGLVCLPVRGQAVVTAAGALVTMLLCLVPVVLRTGSLHLGDLAIAQLGGIGNWFILRDPFLFAAAMIYLLTAARLWPTPPAAGAGGWLAIALGAGLPLVLAHLFTVVFLGGWWAWVHWLDGLTWLQTILKNLLVVGFMVWLRQRPAWRDPGSVAWRLPAAALIACLGAVTWVVLSGAIL
jgi:hypothetical protein